MSSYSKFFLEATGHEPYTYQRRLAESATWPKVLQAPTGTGKTAGVVLAWAWKRQRLPYKDSTPRRLVYCLPMRVLVEQTRDNVEDYFSSLGLQDKVGLYTLMGGEVNEDWHLDVERDTVIIGTQDMLLSRALNRGYVLSRFRWPIPFGLLNNDALWVLDEVQLMGSGVPTTAQLDAFREQYGTFGPARTLWMSATLQPEWLQTVDHGAPSEEECLQLGNEERADPRMRSLLRAPKTLSSLSLRSSVRASTYPGQVAKKVLDLHEPGTRTLVMVNTVARAQLVYESLLEKAKGRVGALLLHSRLRPPERKEKLKILFAPVDASGPGCVIVTTQVLEAGVDISSATLVTELAPWSSIVQRFGRCNRYGEYLSANVYWINVPDSHPAPYDASMLQFSRRLLSELEGASVAPEDLPDPDLLSEHHQVIRRKDLLELFDTTPDLSGNDIDVSGFIRDSRQTEVRAYWRSWPSAEDPPNTWPRPTRDELCPVPVGELRDFLLSKREGAWSWDHLERGWQRIRPWDIRPGQSIMLQSIQGGYDPEMGWNPSVKAEVPPCLPEGSETEEASGDDHLTFLPGVWQTLAEHSREVSGEVEALLDALGISALQPFSPDLVDAGLYHDWGKVHPVFQQTLLSQADEAERASYACTIWAKAKRRTRPGPHKRPHFRHEFASLLALLARESKDEQPVPSLSDLALYLVASHHGRVRLAARSLPGRDGHTYESASPRMVLGIEDGDLLPKVDLDGGERLPEVLLDLTPVQIGDGPKGRSWLARSLSLLDELGPFRLAYLEALFRAADARASARAARGGNV